MRRASTLGLLCLLGALACSRPTRALPELGEIPQFSLIDHKQHRFDRSALLGKVTVVDFVFTRCQSVCPLVTMRMRDLQSQTRELGSRFQLVSFSVDPEHDTAKVLEAYARKAKAEPRWRFVTGEADQMQRLLAQGFKVAMDPMGVSDGGAPNVIHSEHFVLVDRHAKIRGYYESSEPARMSALARDLRALLR